MSWGIQNSVENTDSKLCCYAQFRTAQCAYFQRGAVTTLAFAKSHVLLSTPIVILTSLSPKLCHVKINGLDSNPER